MNEQFPSSSSQPNSQVSASPQAPPSVGIEESPKSGSVWKYLLVALAAMLLVAATAGVTYWILNREEVSDTEDVLQTEENTVVEEKTNVVNDNSSVKEEVVEENEAMSVDPYEGWNTYANDDFLVSFRYPSGWEITENSGEFVPSAETLDVVLTDNNGYDVLILGLGHTGVAVATGNYSTVENEGIIVIEDEVHYKYDCDTLDSVSQKDMNPPVVYDREGCFRLHKNDLTINKIDDFELARMLNYLGNDNNPSSYYIWYGNMSDALYINSREKRTESKVPTDNELEIIEIVVKSISGL